MEQVAKVMRGRILEWFGYVKRSHETDITAGAEMMIERKRPRGKHGRDGGTLSGRSWRNRPLQVRNVKSLWNLLPCTVRRRRKVIVSGIDEFSK